MTTHRHDDDDDIEHHPMVLELRRALEVQAGIIGSIHGDGDAKTRRSDHGPVLRRSVDSLLFVLVGIIIGALGTYATITGRIATLETIVAAHGLSLQTNEARWEKLYDRLDSMGRTLEGIAEQLKHRQQDR